MNDLEIRTRQPVSEVVKEQAGDPIKEGWGVFQNVSGLSCMPYSSLRSVRKKEEDAQTEAEGLNDTEASVVYEIEGDPESNVYRQVHFNTGRVTLSGSNVQLIRVDKYSRVIDQPNAIPEDDDV